MKMRGGVICIEKGMLCQGKGKGVARNERVEGGPKYVLRLGFL